MECHLSRQEFFLTVKDLIRTGDRSAVKWSEKETLLNKRSVSVSLSLVRLLIVCFYYRFDRYHETVDAIDTALCDNIDTRSACEHIRQLISWSNLYLKESVGSQSPNVTLLESIASYVTKILDVFGVSQKTQTIGFANESNDVNNREAIVMPFLEIIADLREQIRSKAKQTKDKDLLDICDRLRDDILPEVGVRLEDYEVGDGQTKTRLKLVDRETLQREREDKLKAQELKRLEKEKKAREKAVAEAKKEEEKKLCPTVMFVTEGDKYSAFDDKGMPTHDSDGKELTKSALKKLSKVYSTQLKRHSKCSQCQNIVVENN